MHRHRFARGLASLGCAVVLTVGCSGMALQQTAGESRAFAATADTLRKTPAFSGDTLSDSAFYDYGRNQVYRLMTAAGSVLTDSAGRPGSIELCVEEGSVNHTATELQDHTFRAIGCIIRSGPTSGDFPYLESGLSYVLVRLTTAGVWQARLLGLTSRKDVRMFVSNTPITTMNAEARRFTQGGRIYLCYTCDRKACCPQPPGSLTNPAQAQSDVDAIAPAW